MNGMDGTIHFTHTDIFISPFDGREGFCVYASCDGVDDFIGRVDFAMTGKSLVAEAFDVHPNFQRYGIGTALYKFAEEISGRKVRPSKRRSRDALLFWKGFRKKTNWKKDYFVFYPRPLVRKKKK